MASGNKIRWRYTDDKGNNYTRVAQKSLTDQGGAEPYVGGVAGVDGDAAMPTNLKPRYVLVAIADGTVRKVVCYTSDAPLYAGTQNTITLTHNGADVVFSDPEPRGERRGRKIRQTT